MQKLTQAQIKALATEIVGDGESPNKFFVSVSPYFRMVQDTSVFGEGHRDAVLEGFDAEKDYTIYGPFDTLEEAEECYNDQELDDSYGVGSVYIEDRETGTVKEKWLEGYETIKFTEREY